MESVKQNWAVISRGIYEGDKCVGYIKTVRKY